MSLLFIAIALVTLESWHWALLGLLAVLVMAAASRISIASAAATPARRKDIKAWSDGGAFSGKPRAQSRADARPVVHDGGSFERSKSA